MGQWCSLSCLLEVEESKAGSLLSLWVGLVLTGWEPFAWVPWGVYIGLPPRGTIVIRPGVGPGCKSLWWPASPPAAGARRLVGPADSSATEPTGRPRRSRVLSAADHCSRDANDAGSVKGAWLQPRRLAGNYCSHSVSRLVNGVWAPRKRRADCWGPTSLRSDWWGSSHLSSSHCRWGPSSLGRTDRPSWEQGSACLW